MTDARSILTLNTGSSSLKFALFDAETLTATVRGAVQGLDGEKPRLIARDEAGAVLADQTWPAGTATSFTDGLDALLRFAEARLGPHCLAAAGHRVVQGGADHVEPERVTSTMISALETLTPLDPLHLPRALAAMQALAAARPSLAQVACFDTAFHHTLPEVFTRYALPRALSDAGVRRYGFHGLSCEYIAGRLVEVAPRLAQGRVIVAHLGSGASLCALDHGASVATTTGFSALEGLVMATRCGSIDPGVLLYLASQGRSVSDIEDILYNQSGLLGMSGISGDVRSLLCSDDPHAKEALDVFSYRIALDAGAMVSALGGLDGLVFTAGVGEHSAAIRTAVCGRLAWLGITLHEAANAVDTGCISGSDSRVDVRVIATDEEAMIARHTQATIRRLPAPLRTVPCPPPS